MSTKKQKYQLDQQGNVLLLSLLIMSGLVVGGVILGSVVVSQLKQSRQLDNAIVAYYAAESGAEYALLYWRDTRCQDCTEPLQNENCLEQQTSGIGWMCTHNQTDNIVKANFSLTPMQVEQIPLYLPEDPATPAEVTSLRVNWQDKTSNAVEPWLEISLVGWPASGLVSYDDQKEIVRRVYKCLRPDSSKPDCSSITMTDFDVDYSYIVRLRALYEEAANVQVRFFNGTDDVDLENYIRSVDFTGVFQGTKQSLRVQFPLVTPAAAMFDFVLFSEESLYKSIF